MESITVKNLSKNYGKVCALDGVSLEIERGELFGLLGVNGAGKTTLIKILSGLTKKTSGEAFVEGYSVDGEMDEIKKIIDVSPQETAVAPNLTVEENFGFFAEVYGQNDFGYIEELKEKFGLSEVAKRRAKTLSGGWKRRLSVALALVPKPKIVFLDEPTLGMDVIARRELWKIIRDLKGKATIILTSHYLEETEALCDRAAIMAKGKVLAVGTIDEIKKGTGESSFEDAFVKIVGEKSGYED